MPYIRKNHLTINEDPEIWQIVDEEGTVKWFGTEEELTAKLGHDNWEAGDDPETFSPTIA